MLSLSQPVGILLEPGPDVVRWLRRLQSQHREAGRDLVPQEVPAGGGDHEEIADRVTEDIA